MYELNEFIRRGDAIKTILEKPDMTDDEKAGIILRLNKVPAEDVHPVLFCKDCKHKGWVQEPCHGKSIDYCRLLDMVVRPDFFCSDGEPDEERAPEKLLKWEVVKVVLTPGGDPLLRCPFCKSRDSEHMGGVENPRRWRYCPVCGIKLKGHR